MSAEPIAQAIQRLHLLGVSQELAADPDTMGRAGRDPDESSGPVDSQQGGRPGEAPWTIEAIYRLGATTDFTTAAHILGIGRTLAFDLLKKDAFPVRVLQLGRRRVVPVPDLLRFLGAVVALPQ
jgi:hypothetical protein